jgi:hypothetical protein
MEYSSHIKHHAFYLECLEGHDPDEEIECPELDWIPGVVTWGEMATAKAIERLEFLNDGGKLGSNLD